MEKVFSTTTHDFYKGVYFRRGYIMGTCWNVVPAGSPAPTVGCLDLAALCEEREIELPNELKQTE